MTRAAARVGDSDSGNDTKTQGSSNVFINNKAAHRLGDSDSDNDVMVNGSSTVFNK